MSSISYKQRLHKVRQEVEARYQMHLGCLDGSRDSVRYPFSMPIDHYAAKNELFHLSCLLDILENNPELVFKSDSNIDNIDKVRGTGLNLKKEQKPVEKPDIVAELKHHLATTPKEQLDKEWEDLKEWGDIGPTVEEFLYGKPAEWSEDERIRKWIIAHLASDNSDKLNEAISWLEKQKERPTDEEMLRTLRCEYEKGIADTIAKYEWKDEWSKEDDRIRKGLIEYLESDRDCQPCQDVSFYDEAISWLEKQKCKESLSIPESCKENVKSFTYTEDERMRKDLIDYLKGNLAPGRNLINSWISWLEKQKEQKSTEWNEEDKKKIK